MTWQSTIPEIGVEVNGAKLAPAEVRALSELSVRQKLSAPSQCELIFENLGSPGADAPGIGCGDSLLISVEKDEAPLFAGEVTAVEYDYGSNTGRRIRVRAYDRLHRLRKRQPVRTHVQVTLQQLASELVAEHGGKMRLIQPGELGGASFAFDLPVSQTAR